MAAKKIELAHKVCDYTCMWNGIEDLYGRETGVRVPDYLFFCLGGIGDFIYLKGNQYNPVRMVSWGDGRTKIMYRKVSEIIGFTYRHIENRTFTYALKKAKEQIDMERPVVLGALDMFYLEYYPKICGKMHIPIHYVLMTGYDDEQQCVYLYDCGKEELQTLSYDTLEKALDIEKTSLSGKNAVCCIEFPGKPRSVQQIALEGLEKKAQNALKPAVGFAGISGIRKAAQEIDHWEKELTKEQYQASLKTMLQFSGTVPSLPNRLYGIEEPDNIRFDGCREKIGNLLLELGDEYSAENWKEAGRQFHESGEIIQKIMDHIADYLIERSEHLNSFKEAINKIADLEELAFQSILKSSSVE